MLNCCFTWFYILISDCIVFNIIVLSKLCHPMFMDREENEDNGKNKVLWNYFTAIVLFHIAKSVKVNVHLNIQIFNRIATKDNVITCYRSPSNYAGLVCVKLNSENPFIHSFHTFISSGCRLLPRLSSRLSPLPWLVVSSSDWTSQWLHVNKRH